VLILRLCARAELQWKPPPASEAASTLYATRGQRSGNWQADRTKKNEKIFCGLKNKYYFCH
jgi:hypothetical protein